MDKTNLAAFYEAADVAATEWFQSACYYYKMPTWDDAAECRKTHPGAYTFRNPNFDHPTGYWTMLTYIANHDGVKRRELCEAFKLKSVSLTADCTLRKAGLVKLDSYTHKFTVTLLGRVYIALANRAREELKILRDAKVLKDIG